MFQEERCCVVMKFLVCDNPKSLFLGAENFSRLVLLVQL